MIQRTFQELISYLQKPVDQIASEQHVAVKIERLFGVLLIDLGVMVLLIGLLSALEALGLLPLEENMLPEMLEQFPVWQLLLLVVLLVPFLEELIFRAYLRFDRNLLFILILGVIGFTGKENRARAETAIRRRWDAYYPTIFYLAAVIFGLVHISNYEMTSEVLWVAPILVLPQIVVGLLLGFLRVRYGLIWGFFLHALHNFAFLGIPLLFFGKEILSQM